MTTITFTAYPTSDPYRLTGLLADSWPIAIGTDAAGTDRLLVFWEDREIPTISLSVIEGGQITAASSDDTRTWPEVAAILPRNSWPAETFAGQRAGVHDAPADLRAIIDAEAAKLGIFTALLSDHELRRTDDSDGE